MTRVSQTVSGLLREQVEYRELLLQMTHRDLLLRYKQTIMGFGWAIFMPLVNTAIFSVIFTRVAPLDTGIPYPLYAYSGLLAWNFVRLVAALRGHVADGRTSTLVTKVYFPREIFPFSAVLVTLVDSLVGGARARGDDGLLPRRASAADLSCCRSWCWCRSRSPARMALLLAMANLFFRDVKYLLEIVITLWMFATSVVYPIELVRRPAGGGAAAEPDDADHRRPTAPCASRRGSRRQGRSWPPPSWRSWRSRSAWLVFHRAESGSRKTSE